MEVKIYYKDNLIETLNLLASETIDEVNKFTKLLRSINFLIWVMSKKPLIVFEGIEGSGKQH